MVLWFVDKNFFSLSKFTPQKKYQPFFAFDLGYSFDISSLNYEGILGVGVLFNPKVGLIFHEAKKKTLSIGIGYDMQQASGNNFDASNVVYGAISLNLSFSF